MLNYARTLLGRLGLNNTQGLIALFVVLVVLYYLFNPQANLLQFGGGKKNKNSSSSSKRGGGGTSVKKLVLYYAPWCGHCQKLKPTWAQLEQKYNGKIIGGQTIKIEKVNGDEEKEIVQSLNIDGFPTIILYKSNGEKLSYNGNRTLEDLSQFVSA